MTQKFRSTTQPRYADNVTIRPSAVGRAQSDASGSSLQSTAASTDAAFPPLPGYGTTRPARKVNRNSAWVGFRHRSLLLGLRAKVGGSTVTVAT